MIEVNRVLEAKFGDLNSPLALVAIEDLALPVYKVFLDCLGEIRRDLEPTTEYLLKFLDLGISSVEDLAGVMGLTQDLVLDLVLAECAKGHTAFVESNTKVAITVTGRSLLKTLQSSVGTNIERTQVFDSHLWKIQDWATSDFLTEKQMDGYLVDSPVRVSKSKKSRVEKEDISVVALNRILARVSKDGKEIHQVRRVQRRVNGFKLAKLLIYFDGKSDSAFTVIIDGKRSIEHEEYLQSLGGLQSLGIVLDPVPEDELEGLNELRINDFNVLPEIKDVLNIVRPYDHPEYFNRMLENSARRLVIMSPWITNESDEVFREKIEILLKNNVKIVIAYGYETKRGQKLKDSPEAIRALFELSKKYRNFEFRKFKNDNHGKVLISDDIIIIGSFNWLSYGGRPDRKTKVIRGEYSLMTSNSKVSTPLIDFFEKEVIDISVPMKSELIPALESSTGASYNPNKIGPNYSGKGKNR